MERRTELIAKIRAQHSPMVGAPLPVVSLEDFFIGNSDHGSIGCNLANNPGPQKFYKELKEMRGRPDVQDILVEINEVQEDDLEAWPFSDRVYILTSVSSHKVAYLVSKLHPDEIERGWAHGAAPSGAPPINEGNEIYSIWWD